MKVKILSIIIIFLLVSCTRKSIKEDATDAANEYCDCVRSNIFKFKKRNEIYSSCYDKLYKKYRFFKLYADNLSSFHYNSSKQQEDSINEFMDILGEKSDSCYCLPK